MKYATLAVLLGVTAANNSDHEFTQWQASHGKSYRTREEFLFRKNEWAKTKNFVDRWNSDSENTHTVAMNKFSDWTEDEKSRLLGFH